MSRRFKNLTVICVEKPAICELCGKKDELRPYGPGGKAVCYDCAMKTPEITEHNMKIRLFGDPGELR